MPQGSLVWVPGSLLCPLHQIEGSAFGTSRTGRPSLCPLRAEYAVAPGLLAASVSQQPSCRVRGNLTGNAWDQQNFWVLYISLLL